jgi:hypothetical protein
MFLYELSRILGLVEPPSSVDYRQNEGVDGANLETREVTGPCAHLLLGLLVVGHQDKRPSGNATVDEMTHTF